MNYPIRNDYELTLLVKGTLDRIFYGRKVIVKFQEGTIRELLEFENIKKDDEKLLKWLVSVVKLPMRVIANDVDILVPMIVGNMFLGAYKKQEKIKEQNVSPFSSYITFVCKEIGITPHDLINNYTLRELEYISEGIVRNLNEQSEEGQKRNKKSLQKQEAKKIDWEKLEIIHKQQTAFTNSFRKNANNKPGTTTGGQESPITDGEDTKEDTGSSKD